MNSNKKGGKKAFCLSLHTITLSPNPVSCPSRPQKVCCNLAAATVTTKWNLEDLEPRGRIQYPAEKRTQRQRMLRYTGFL